jgi:acetyl esterase/lipase
MTEHILEPAAQDFADATATPPFLYELGPEAGRKVLDDVQAAPIDLLPVDEKWITVPAPVGDVRVRIVKPAGAAYEAARWITADGAAAGLDASRLAIAGDSVGGNMSGVVAILAQRRGDVTFRHQSLYYPVTDAGQDTGSYREFADGPHLTAKAMAWYWDAYLPEVSQRADVTVSPLRASPEDLAGLPEAFVVVDENDVLRDEGEAYARKLVAAGVCTTCVRYNGTPHGWETHTEKENEP